MGQLSAIGKSGPNRSSLRAHVPLTSTTMRMWSRRTGCGGGNCLGCASWLGGLGRAADDLTSFVGAKEAASHDTRNRLWRSPWPKRLKQRSPVSGGIYRLTSSGVRCPMILRKTVVSACERALNSAKEQPRMLALGSTAPGRAASPLCGCDL